MWYLARWLPGASADWSATAWIELDSIGPRVSLRLASEANSVISVSQLTVGTGAANRSFAHARQRFLVREDIVLWYQRVNFVAMICRDRGDELHSWGSINKSNRKAKDKEK